MRQSHAADGVVLLEARFHGHPYRKHRHDTYAIGLTDAGVQAFSYHGNVHVSMPGGVVIPHPDEIHDGFAATESGFRYRLVYVDPALVFEAVRALRGSAGFLPFARQPVVSNRGMASAIVSAFMSADDPLAVDELIVRLTDGLLEADPGASRKRPLRHLDPVAVERARQFLDAERTRVVRSVELEAVSGLTRFELARHFRTVTGTSPYRYLLMRRLDLARNLIDRGGRLIDIALEAGFSDQAHLTRVFADTLGITPGRCASLRTSPSGWRPSATRLEK